MTHGCFYSICIASDGSVITEKKHVSDMDIEDNTVSGGKLIENTITARELNVQSIFADEALIGAITAANINVSDLMASEALEPQRQRTKKGLICRCHWSKSQQSLMNIGK